MAFQQKDIARTLRPYTLHAQQLMAQARADVERLPAVLAQVQRALEHAGLADTFRLLQKRRGGRCHCAGLDDGGLGWGDWGGYSLAQRTSGVVALSARAPIASAPWLSAWWRGPSSSGVWRRAMAVAGTSRPVPVGSSDRGCCDSTCCT
jgi:hypothetical protein